MSPQAARSVEATFSLLTRVGSESRVDTLAPEEWALVLGAIERDAPQWRDALRTLEVTSTDGTGLFRLLMEMARSFQHAAAARHLERLGVDLPSESCRTVLYDAAIRVASIGRSGVRSTWTYLAALAALPRGARATERRGVSGRVHLDVATRLLTSASREVAAQFLLSAVQSDAVKAQAVAPWADGELTRADALSPSALTALVSLRLLHPTPWSTPVRRAVLARLRTDYVVARVEDTEGQPLTSDVTTSVVPDSAAMTLEGLFTRLLADERAPARADVAAFSAFLLEWSGDVGFQSRRVRVLAAWVRALSPHRPLAQPWTPTLIKWLAPGSSPIMRASASGPALTLVLWMAEAERAPLVSALVGSGNWDDCAMGLVRLHSTDLPPVEGALPGAIAGLLVRLLGAWDQSQTDLVMALPVGVVRTVLIELAAHRYRVPPPPALFDRLAARSGLVDDRLLIALATAHQDAWRLAGVVLSGAAA